MGQGNPGSIRRPSTTVRRRTIAVLAGIVAALATVHGLAQDLAPPDFMPATGGSLLGSAQQGGEMLRFVSPGGSTGVETIRFGQAQRANQVTLNPLPPASALPENLPATTAAPLPSVPAPATRQPAPTAAGYLTSSSYIASPTAPQLLPQAQSDGAISSARRMYLASQAQGDNESDAADSNAGDGEAGENDSDADSDKKSDEKKGEPQKFGREPESYSMQFLRTQDVLLKPCTWQFDTGFDYAHFVNQFPVAVVDGGGNVVGVVQGETRNRLLYSPFAARYGWSENVQLFAALPVGFSNIQTSTLGSSTDNNSGGLGDLTAGSSVHIFGAQDDLPDVIGTFSFTAPTGKFNAPVFGIVPGSALGQGFWAISGQLLCINQYDPIVVFYGGGYRHLFKREFEGVPFAPGEQINYMMGVGFSVNDRVTLSGIFQGFYITNFELNNQVVEGSNLEPLSVRLAATIVRRGHIIEPFVYIGLTPSAPDALFGITLTYY